MNSLIKILTILILCVTIGIAQNSSDTAADRKEKEIEKKSAFIDENANGVDDRLEQKQKAGKQKRMRDRFVDLDGDGICDGRQSGIGIRSRHSEKQDKQHGQKRHKHG